MAIRILLCLISVATASVVNAKIQVGKFVSQSATGVSINGKNANATSPIYWGDQFETDKSSTAEILIYPSLALKIMPATKIKIVGNLIEEKAGTLDSQSVINVSSGRIQGQLLKKEDEKNNVRIYGKRTISSVRGTIFEIDTTSSVEAQVFEGHVAVSVPLEKKDLEINAGESVDLSSGAKIKEITSDIPKISAVSIAVTTWKEDASAIVASHKKEAQRYRKLLQEDISKMNRSLKKDAASVYGGLKGTYEKRNTEK